MLTHKGQKCRNTATCLRCAGNHTTRECKSTEVKCMNCEYSNNRYCTNLQTDHEATCYEKCMIFKRRIDKYIDNTDYRVRPDVMTAIGKALNNVNNRRSTHNQPD